VDTYAAREQGTAESPYESFTFFNIQKVISTKEAKTNTNKNECVCHFC
jgi:hypothetical protein